MVNRNLARSLLALLLALILPLACAETGTESYTLTWADAPALESVPESYDEADAPTLEGVPVFSETSDDLPDPDALFPDALPTDAVLTPEQILADLTLREKIGQMFIVRPEKLSFEYRGAEPVRVDGGKTALTDVMRAAYTRYPVGGFVLFAENIEDPPQLRQFLADLNSLCPVTPFLAVDEEGGRVARLANKASMGLDNVGSMGSIGETGDAEQAFAAGAAIGAYLSDYGFTLDFAPVADLQGPVIGNRSFGTDPEGVSSMAGAFIEGLHSQGVMSCLKHFPGLGSSVSDTHAGAAEIEKTGAEMLSSDLIPFIDNLNATDMVMVSHASMTGMLNDDTPASLSPQIITQGLRGRLGYTGVVITDSLEMRAVTGRYKSAEAAVTAISAGADILLMPSSLISAFDGVVAAVEDGRISEGRIDESVLRVLRLKLGG
ncbi:MAG: glycoside hydrolase family 3 protein [Clostridia bacterium]|nr:glycoside hydrolase family 3 protein [Clostridia bacterium]